jgi:NitT/TauT family transport system substrate-binding protein
VLIASKEFVRKYPVATKRVLRAILKATDLCASNPAAVARRLVDGGFTENYDYALQTLNEVCTTSGASTTSRIQSASIRCGCAKPA